MTSTATSPCAIMVLGTAEGAKARGERRSEACEILARQSVSSFFLLIAIRPWYHTLDFDTPSITSFTETGGLYSHSRSACSSQL